MRKIIFMTLIALLSGAPAPQAATTLPPTAPPSFGYEGLQPLPSQGPNRLYWNTIQQPRSLEMRGATWKDPALVPQLSGAGAAKKNVAKTTKRTGKKTTTAKRRTTTRKAPAKKTATASTVPPLTAPNPHDEDRARGPIAPFDPFADSRPMPPERLQ